VLHIICEIVHILWHLHQRPSKAYYCSTWGRDKREASLEDIILFIQRNLYISMNVNYDGDQAEGRFRKNVPNIVNQVLE
jgi:hypothetical protein